MRTNLPVTEQEYVLNELDFIQSRTDANGIITDINDNFVIVSGFERHELIGQPHNIVRHPDTPVELFEDLWRTVKAGRIWSGVLKNRRKNGDFYWVKTDISPLRKDGKFVELVSSRWKVGEPDRQKFERIYTLFKSGEGRKYRFKEGELVKRGLFG